MKISERDIKEMVKECTSLLMERNMDTLYHFVCIDSLLHILKTNRFDLNDCGDGTYYMSTTRNKNSVQGYPYMQSDYSQGGGSYHNAGFWGIICRLELDGELLRRYGKMGPFDYIYDEGDVPDENGGYLNGKQDAMTYFGDSEEMYHQPFSQGEERLVSKQKSIPNADRIINRIDVYIDPYEASQKEWQEANGKGLKYLIKKYGDMIDFYDNRSMFDHQINESPLISENAINERGGSEILYHFTSINALKSILQNNGAEGGYFSMSSPKKVDASILGREKSGKGKFTHYMSLTRSPNANWGYVKALDKGASFGKDNNSINVSPNSPDSVGSVRLTFDGKKLSAGRIIKPVDFFGPYTDEKGRRRFNKETASGKWADGDPQKRSMIKQAEDRLLGFTYDFDGILNYITRIDIFAPGSASKSVAKEILDLSKGTPVDGKVHVYDDFRAFNRPDFDRIKGAAAKRGLSPMSWRPEINGAISDFEFKDGRKKETLIEKSKLTNIAVFVWATLFIEKYTKINENYSQTGEFKFNELFSLDNVRKVIAEIVAPIRDKKLNKEFFNTIFNEYCSLSNASIARYCFSANPKFDAMRGIAKTMENSIYKIAKEKFNFSTYKTLFTKASNIMKKLWPNDISVKLGKNYKKERYERAKAKQNLKKNASRQELAKQHQMGKAAGAALKKTEKPKVTGKSRGTKRRYDVVIPSLTFRCNGQKLTINDVTNTSDAIQKLSALMPSYDFMSKRMSIAVKVSNAKKALSEPTLFNEEDIREMVNECLRRLNG